MIKKIYLKIFNKFKTLTNQLTNPYKVKKILHYALFLFIFTITRRALIFYIMPNISNYMPIIIESFSNFYMNLSDILPFDLPDIFNLKEPKQPEPEKIIKIIPEDEVESEELKKLREIERKKGERAVLMPIAFVIADIILFILARIS
jgi:hypothetical protein